MWSPADKLILEMIKCEETLLKFVKVASLEFIIIDKFCLWLQTRSMHASKIIIKQDRWNTCTTIKKYDYKFNHFIMCWTDCVTVNVL